MSGREEVEYLANGDDETDSSSSPRSTTQIECGSCESLVAEQKSLMKYCGVCRVWLCQGCVHIHGMLPALRIHQLTDDQTTQKPMYTQCRLHEGELLTLYCRRCKRPVCKFCQLESQHLYHKFIDIDEVVDLNRQTLAAEVANKAEIRDCMRRMKRECESEFTEADEKLSEFKALFNEAIEKVREENKLKKCKFLSEVDAAVDQLTEKIAVWNSYLGSYGSHVMMSDLVDAPSCAIGEQPVKPIFFEGIVSVLETFLRTVVADLVKLPVDKSSTASVTAIRRNVTAGQDNTTVMGALMSETLTAEYVQEIVDTRGTHGLRLLQHVIGESLHALSINRPGLLLPIKDYLKRHQVSLVQYQYRELLPGNRISLVSLDWAKTYITWINDVENKALPEHVKHLKPGKEGNLDGGEHLFVCENDAKLLRSIFGCSQPLPLATKACIVENEYGSFYVVAVREVKKLSALNAPVYTRLFDGFEHLPSGRLFIRDTEVTEQCQGKCLFEIFSGLGMSHRDELVVLSET